MLTRDTTLVLGAGASADLGLPIGDDLRKIIQQLVEMTGFPNSQQMFSNRRIEDGANEWLRVNGISYADGRYKFATAAKVIHNSLIISGSIDDVLKTFSGDHFVKALGKLCIAQAILTSERESKMCFQPPLDAQARGKRPFPSIEALNSGRNWHIPFMRLMFSNTELRDVEEVLGRLHVVSFNYDRCFEQAMLMGLQARYAIQEDAAATFLESLDIVHPYGDLGDLAWQIAPEHQNKAVPYGFDEVQNLVSVSESIRTFTESAAEGTELQVKRMIGRETQIILLGFGFHDQNVELLTPLAGEHRARRIWGTGSNVSNNTRDAWSLKIQQLAWSGGGDIQLDAADCVDFVRNRGVNLFQA